MSDIASALTQSLSSDGQTPPTANLPMGNFKHTGVANASVRTEYASAGQVEDGALTALTTVAGTDTITAVASLAMSAYAAGQLFSFIAAGANTGAATININGIGAKAITKKGSTALVAGDMASGAAHLIRYDGTQFQLLNINDDEWANSGLTPTYVSTTSYTVVGDQTSALHIGRRQKFTTTSGTVYGRITNSVFTTLTTVTVQMDGSQVLDSGLTAVQNSILRANVLSLPVRAGTAAGTDTYTATVGIARLVIGDEYRIKIPNANTLTTPTLNLDSTGANTIVNIDGSALYARALNGEHTFRWNGTNMVVLNPTVGINTVPAGAVVSFAMSSAPTGWLKGNGAAVSRTTYASLFTAIGTTFGAGDGSTTFNLPELRGEFIRNWDDARGIDSGRGFGSAQAEAFKQHTHGIPAQLDVSYPAGGIGRVIFGGASSGGDTLISTTGGTETRPRNVALLACIKY